MERTLLVRHPLDGSNGQNNSLSHHDHDPERVGLVLHAVVDSTGTCVSVNRWVRAILEGPQVPSELCVVLDAANVAPQGDLVPGHLRVMWVERLSIPPR
jgi:hypothetical protein